VKRRKLVLVWAVILPMAIRGSGVPLEAQPVSSQAIFDGESLFGWEGDVAVFRVENGVIVGESTGESAYLCTTQRFGDFTLTLEAMLQGPPGAENGGVFFRSERIPDSPRVAGYQADMGHISPLELQSLLGRALPDTSSAHPLWGLLIDEFRDTPGRYVDPQLPVRILSLPERGVVDPIVNASGWNRVRIEADGSRIAIELNGVLTVDFTEDAAVPRSGRVCLQAYPGEGARASYRGLSLRLKTTP